MKILYFGWIGHNNTGDELMFEGFKSLIKEKYGSSIEVDGISCGEEYDQFDGYDLVCLGGGSILLDGYIKVLFKALESGKKIVIWGSGYDELNSEDFIEKIEKSNMPAYVYLDATEDYLYDISKKSLFFGVRGPITYKILEKSNIDMNNIIVSGDPGFLLKSSSNENPYKFSKKEKVVAINIGTSFNNIYGKDESNVEEELIKVIKYLVCRNYKIYLYTVWDKDINKTLNLYNKLDFKDKIILDLNVRPASDLLNILNDCIFTINFKLHGNVISAATSVPFISLTYRLKGYDFVKSINCEDLNIPTNTVELSKKICEKIGYIEENYDKLVNKININVEYYRKILKKSLDNII